MEITREQLALVVRRAVELAATEVDAEDRLSEDEVLRIAGELGLPPHHVRRALYELPTAGRRGLLDRTLGTPRESAVRAVAGEPEPVMTLLEEHFATREYLRLLRRREGYALFAPADDALSRIARSVRGVSSRELCRVRELAVSVRPLGPERTHVRLDLDLSNRRGGALAAGIAAGAGVFIGTATLLAGVAAPFAPAAVLDAVVATAFGAGGLAGAWTGVRVARGRVAAMLASVRTEAEGLLDRLERGETLAGPPPPWRRRLQRPGHTRAPR